MSSYRVSARERSQHLRLPHAGDGESVSVVAEPAPGPDRLDHVAVEPWNPEGGGRGARQNLGPDPQATLRSADEARGTGRAPSTPPRPLDFNSNPRVFSAKKATWREDLAPVHLPRLWNLRHCHRDSHREREHLSLLTCLAWAFLPGQDVSAPSQPLTRPQVIVVRYIHDSRGVDGPSKRTARSRRTDTEARWRSLARYRRRIRSSSEQVSRD